MISRKLTHKILDLFKQGTSANYSEKCRVGNVVELGPEVKLIATGDLHGNKRNFDRIVKYADLENNSNTHLMFQEILHGGPEDENGGCMSFELLFDVIDLQLRFPEQVHTIIGNHDTAVICDNDVLKAGKEMNSALKLAMKSYYGSDFGVVTTAMKEYLISQPLAIRTANRVWLSHSLPADRFVESFDPDILTRPLELEDLQRPKSAYSLTWGRRHSQKAIAKMAEVLDVDLFVLGHQPQETGWAMVAENVLIIASEHSHGCLVPIDLAEECTAKKLADSIVLLASIE